MRTEELGGSAVDTGHAQHVGKEQRTARKDHGVATSTSHASSVASMSLNPHEVSTLTFLDNAYTSHVVHPVSLKEDSKALFNMIESRATHKDNWLQRRMAGDTDGQLDQNLDSYIDAC